MTKRKVITEVCPKGYVPQLWRRLTDESEDLINQLLEYDQEIALEQQRDFDLKYLVALALYDGYLFGFSDVVHHGLGGELGKLPPLHVLPERYRGAE